MNCPKCGNNCNNQDKFCLKCGANVQNAFYQPIANQSNINIFDSSDITGNQIKYDPTTSFSYKTKEFIKKNKKWCIVTIAIVFFAIIFFIIYNSISKYLYSKSLYFSFTINEENFKIGEKVSYYESKGFSYKDSYYKNTDIIVSDGFIPHSFYKNETAVMYGAIHCKKEKNCAYSEGNIVKINFYENIGKVVFADFITFGTSYDEIVEKLGDPDGKFYMNDNEYVWAFYEKGNVDNPYYVLEFDSSNLVIGMKMGMWWYDGEYEYTVKK